MFCDVTDHCALASAASSKGRMHVQVPAAGVNVLLCTRSVHHGMGWGKALKGGYFQGFGRFCMGKRPPPCICQGRYEKVSILWDNYTI